ncbi:vWA domain-containing protein [Pararhodospirillum oryzae]|uniref:Serine/threonine protein kinase n=1 Tax=Pararhodospirillum oryzae TaxID=478448 RepID=A0A512H8F1_9PROT|nr:vWA domain-containing protein [Pararhodospirillum oryzae]GEO81722.1 serine/threonine protein kinase [Pararhodospirillum oryzae]
MTTGHDHPINRNRHPWARVLALVLILMGGAGGLEPRLAQAAPLLIPGKTTLYQRILTRPGAVIVTTPDSGREVARPHAFSAYYVFQVVNRGATDWLAVGPSQRGEPIGWIARNKTVEWRSTIILTFTPAVGRQPTLFFDTEAAARAVAESPDLDRMIGPLVADTRAGRPPAGSGIISIEPRELVDFDSRFYLLPVLEARQVMLDSGYRATLTRVASIPTDETREPSREPYRVGIVFVIDSTKSMQPYIDRTREAVRRIFSSVRASDIADKVSFGAVEFRDSVEAVPGLGFVSRVVAPLRLPPDHEDFLRRLDTIQATSVSSQGFQEDGLAGVMAAVRLDEWKNFAGKYIIYFSDADMREPPDPLATTGYVADHVNKLAKENKIGIFSLLLATPQGENSHRRAEQQMRALSHWDGAGTQPFYRVPDGNLADFGPRIDRLTENLIGQVREAAGGASPDLRDADALTLAAHDMGQAMRLAWLGRVRGTAAPDILEAWAPDIALDNPDNKAFTIQILLTKNQLSRLRDALTLVLEAGQTTLHTRPDQFFDQLRLVVGRAMREGTVDLPDPSRITALGDLMGEYLDGLPYQSELTGITPDRWRLMGASEQDLAVVRIRSKLRAYQEIHDNADLWRPLVDGAPDDEKVAAIPLSLLP